MLDTDYSYLAARFVAERNRTRIASCPEAAVAHQKLADAYLGRLQSMILSPDTMRRNVFSVQQNLSRGTNGGEGDIAKSLDTRDRGGRPGNLL